MEELRIPLRRILGRGLRGTCPNCNSARLFRAYLKSVNTCPNCGERWADIRADLAPAWASMTIAAHIVVPIYHFVFFDSGLSTAVQTAALMALAIGICLIALPRMKGLFMAIVWAKGTQDS
jgi:uncharacterized protein (DUF983 family)